MICKKREADEETANDGDMHVAPPDDEFNLG
jgi:hypothetical protein